jgi:hypothetical protein
MVMCLVFGRFWLSAGIDTFLVRHPLAPDPARLYGTAVNIVLLVPGAFVIPATLGFASQYGREPKANRLLGQITLSALGLALAGLIVVPPGPLVRILF